MSSAPTRRPQPWLLWIAVLAALNLAYQLAEAPRAAEPTPPEVDALIRRLDEALGQDGQLL